MKSILADFRSLKTAIFILLEALDQDICGNCTFVNKTIALKSKFRLAEMV